MIDHIPALPTSDRMSAIARRVQETGVSSADMAAGYCPHVAAYSGLRVVTA
jgi:hypothetical protein